MHEEMKGRHMHGGMKGHHMHSEMKKGRMMMKFVKKYLSEEDQKKLAVKKLDMKIARTQGKLEYLNMIREMLAKES